MIEGRCDLVSQILEVTTKSGVNILDNDIIVLTDKIVSKCLGKVVSIDDVKVSKKALKLARRSGLDPKFVELVLRNSDDLVAVVPIKKLVDYGFIDL
ncbi:MAG: coenzyme F420-0:L-glutamate ligase, partial [Desulfurococcaceae archaeon]|nr:coenzyme F420-0:L-glutamate ligase [Desulfurococcaceae archaeon]